MILFIQYININVILSNKMYVVYQRQCLQLTQICLVIDYSSNFKGGWVLSSSQRRKTDDVTVFTVWSFQGLILADVHINNYYYNSLYCNVKSLTIGGTAITWHFQFRCIPQITPAGYISQKPWQQETIRQKKTYLWHIILDKKDICFRFVSVY